MRIVNYIHKVQGFDKAFPILLELKTHCPEIEIMTVLDLEEKTRIDVSDFFCDLCVDVSDHIAIYDNSEFCADIGAKAGAAGKLRHHAAGRSTPANGGTIGRALRGSWGILTPGSRKDSASDLLNWACNAEYLLSIYNGLSRPHADDLRRAVKSNEGKVIGYFKAINDEGRGISALANPLIRKPISQRHAYGADAILLPYDNFRVFFEPEVRAELIPTGYPPFYGSWKHYVETTVDNFLGQRSRDLEVVVLTRGETAHKREADQIISEETLRRLLDDIYDALRSQELPFRMRVKPHPYQDVEALGQYIKDWPEAKIVFDPPVVLAADADLVVAIYSSAILDGLVFGASLIEYYEENAAFRRLHFENSPFGAFGVTIARTRSEFDVAVKDAVKRNECRGSHPKIDEANSLAQRLPKVFSQD